MDRKRGFISLVVLLLIFASIVHSFFHVVVYGTGIPKLAENGLSGYSVGKLDLGEEFSSFYPFRADFSAIIVIIEWIFVISIIVFFYTRRITGMKVEFDDLMTSFHPENSGTKTDLDKLYELLKEKKRLRLSNVAKAFNVDKKVIENWAGALQAGKFITIEYPRFGEPELVFYSKEPYSEKS